MIRLSLELLPSSLLRREGHLLPGLLPHGTRVFLPALPTDPPDAIERALGVLSREGDGLTVVPHVAAQRVASADALERQLAAWQSASDGRLREVLVVRGDAVGHSINGGGAPARPTGGGFESSIALLETNTLQRGGFDFVWMCGHPEGVAGLPAAEARRALHDKLSWAAAAGVRAGVATQFCFDADTTTMWVDELRREGSGCAVSLGMPGPASPQLLSRMADRCSVAPPAANAGGALGREPQAVGDAASGEWPWDYARQLAAWQEARGPERGMQALHLYPFGGLQHTLRWLHLAARDNSLAALGLNEVSHKSP